MRKTSLAANGFSVFLCVCVVYFQPLLKYAETDEKSLYMSESQLFEDERCIKLDNKSPNWNYLFCITLYQMRKHFDTQVFRSTCIET